MGETHVSIETPSLAPAKERVADRDISGDEDVLSGANVWTDDVAVTNANKTYASVLKRRIQPKANNAETVTFEPLPPGKSRRAHSI
jgi:hypothetical protein